MMMTIKKVIMIAMSMVISMLILMKIMMMTTKSNASLITQPRRKRWSWLPKWWWWCYWKPVLPLSHDIWRLTRYSKVASLLGIDPTLMMKSFCKPKIKVGSRQYQSLMSSCNLYLVPLWWNFRPIFQGLALWLVSRFGKEWVTKGQNIDHIWLYNSDYRNGYINTYHHGIFQGWHRVGDKGTEYWPVVSVCGRNCQRALWKVLKHNTIYDTVQYSTIPYNTIQYNMI